MPVYSVQFAVTAEPITFPQIHAESQEQAIQQARKWATHILEALVGFQGRGCAEVVPPYCCHPFLLEALLFQWPLIRRCASRAMVEPKTPESNKSAVGLSVQRIICSTTPSARVQKLDPSAARR